MQFQPVAAALDQFKVKNSKDKRKDAGISFLDASAADLNSTRAIAARQAKHVKQMGVEKIISVTKRKCKPKESIVKLPDPMKLQLKEYENEKDKHRPPPPPPSSVAVIFIAFSFLRIVSLFLITEVCCVSFHSTVGALSVAIFFS